MSVVTHIILALLAFAAHAGVSSATTTGVPIHVLAILTVVSVWVQSPRSIVYRLLPAALCVDILQPTRVPITLCTVLVVWLVAALVQKHWLTNHSVASLAGIALAAITARVLTTWVGIGVSVAFGTSNIPFLASWTWSDNILRLVIECCITIALGVLWRFFQRSMRRTFLYGTS